ncbi:5-carboxymethyl-2-hydroxymuconate isomerase [Bordetella genomosp. 10]|uniref:5-carboxymethyl-2-hydroxymuconate isomerase n=1 Tax=Bordetella genomosp. 10 TaxID=1416804 RepID=A0A261S265_9BORD|nr:fumarylacetoacetate hydrolase family protein [Bordetella genomosp. 10]OZI31077.1 5-carboxymethyl-2-hydroxymuconate isomerase [Bordetella genomosp. 10]
MRLVSYLHVGRPGFGVVQDDRIKVLSDGDTTLMDFLREPALLRTLESCKRELPLADVTLLPPIPNPGKIICIGLNYHEHVAESGRTVTRHPSLFARYPESQVGHLSPMVSPLESDKLDYEGELAVIIGKGGRRIKAEQAMAHIAGYACYNDGSVRDWQHHTSQFLAGKSFVGTGAFGPWMVTADEIEDPRPLRLQTRLNGQIMQDATIDMMITPIPEQIAYISSIMPLAPGDVIVTGTPGGVGTKRTPPVYLRDGDVVEVEIDRVGVLRNPVRAEQRDASV